MCRTGAALFGAIYVEFGSGSVVCSVAPLKIFKTAASTALLFCSCVIGLLFSSFGAALLPLLLFRGCTSDSEMLVVVVSSVLSLSCFSSLTSLKLKKLYSTILLCRTLTHAHRLQPMRVYFLGAALKLQCF